MKLLDTTLLLIGDGEETRREGRKKREKRERGRKEAFERESQVQYTIVSLGRKEGTVQTKLGVGVCILVVYLLSSGVSGGSISYYDVL